MIGFYLFAKGTEIRAVACMAEGRDADPRECNGERPESERACHVLCTTPTPPVGNYKWRTGPWSEVNVFSSLCLLK